MAFIGTIDETIEYLQKLKQQKNYKKEKKYKTLEFRKKRTGPQNNYFHGIIRAIAIEFMLDFNQLKSFYKLKFLKDYKDGLPYIKGTSELTTVEIKEFIEKIRVHAAEFFNFAIPNPGSKEFENFLAYYEDQINNF